MSYNVRVQTVTGVTVLTVTPQGNESVRQAAWRTARLLGLYLLSDTVAEV